MEPITNLKEGHQWVARISGLISEILQVGRKVYKSEAMVYYSRHVNGMLITHGENQTIADDETVLTGYMKH